MEYTNTAMTADQFNGLLETVPASGAIVRKGNTVTVSAVHRQTLAPTEVIRAERTADGWDVRHPVGLLSRVETVKGAAA